MLKHERFAILLTKSIKSDVLRVVTRSSLSCSLRLSLIDPWLLALHRCHDTTVQAKSCMPADTFVSWRYVIGPLRENKIVVPHEEAERLSTLSQAIADTPGAARVTTVTVRGTVVTPAEASRLSTMSQLLADTPGAARGTIASVLSGVGGRSKGEALVPLDKDEEARRSQQKRASDAPSAEPSLKFSMLSMRQSWNVNQVARVQLMAWKHSRLLW